MWSMAYRSAVPEIPAVAAGSVSLAGAAGRACVAFLHLHVSRDCASRRTAGDALTRFRAGLFDLTDQDAQTRALRRRWRLCDFRRALSLEALPVAAIPHVAGPAAPALQDQPTFEGEKVDVTRQPFEPRRLIAGAVSALAEQTPLPGCGIASLIAANVPARVTGDPDLLRHVIERLAGAPLGEGNGVCIRVSAEAGRLRLAFETPWPRRANAAAIPGERAVAAVRGAVETLRGEMTVFQANGAASVRVEIPAPAAGETAVEDAARGAAGARPSPGTCARSA